ncbi:light-harvesting complex protein LHCC4 [Baffinella frigidus]|nr:light-harvesting complex protein LHCC4 [Cryptophyta sp. CCMP2293]
MFRSALICGMAATAAAFAPSGSMLPRTTTRAAISRGPMMQDKAIPFLETPPMLENTDLAGNVFFDPVGFSNYFDIKWLREAELKHGRVCMLAVTGLLAQEFVTLPMFENGATPVDDFFVVPAFGLWQVFFAIGALEFGMNGFKISAADMFADGRDAGDFNFDPLGFGKNPTALARRKLVEVKNGRLAMIGFGGMLHQQLLFKQATIEQLTHFQAIN